MFVSVPVLLRLHRAMVVDYLQGTKKIEKLRKKIEDHR